MLTAYYKFEILPDEIKLKYGIRAKDRLDCTAMANPKGYEGMNSIVSKKGQMYLYKMAAKGIVKANSKRLAEWALGNGTFHFSSIYFEDIEYPEYGYGYPNANRLLKGGNANPLFPYRNDCYLFITNPDMNIIEVLVITDGRNLVTGYYQHLLDGGLDQELNKLREQAEPIFDYVSAL
jgi:hypothetical protein